MLLKKKPNSNLNPSDYTSVQPTTSKSLVPSGSVSTRANSTKTGSFDTSNIKVKR